MRAGKRAALLTAAVLAVVAGVGAFVAHSETGEASTVVAKVNGMDITAVEFRRELDNQRAPVIDYFLRTYQANVTEAFWNTSYGGENPGMMAKDRAMEELIRRKVELGLGSRHGLLSGTAYGDLLEQMDRENKRRAEAVKASQPVYGPVRLAETVFIPYYMSKLRNELKEKVAAADLGVSEEELVRLKMLEKNPAPPETERVRFRKLAVSYRSAGGAGDASSANLQETLALLKQRLEQAAGESGDTSFSREGEDIRVTEEELNRETAGIYFKAQPVLYALLSGGLQAGQASPVFNEALQGELVLVKVLEREKGTSVSGKGGNAPEAGASLDSLYRQYIQQLAAEAEVILCQDFERIRMK
jgi:hypothetical protein